jgi:hypothetical protein
MEAQGIILSVLMSVLAAIIWRRGLAFAFPCLFLYTAFSAAYVPFALSLGTVGDAVSVALRTVAALEAVWRVAEWLSTAAKVILLGTLASFAGAILLPSAMDGAPWRMVVQAGTLIALLGTILLDRSERVNCPWVARANLLIMALWVSFRLANNLAYYFYDSLDAWTTARWFGVAGQAIVVASYGLLTEPREGVHQAHQ